MANKRQRLARKRFTCESGPKEAAPSAPVSSSSPRANSVLKPNTCSKGLKKKAHRKILKKHPLRVPGKKPGDGCFLCKSKDHVAKSCPQKLGTDKKKVCLFCREWGHTLKSCPSKAAGQERKCYNCGEVGHRLAECKSPLKDGGTKFAECFLCKQVGHLSKNCPSNTHGIYPKGGSCKICGGVTHIAKDCPKKDTTMKHNGKQHTKMSISKEVAPSSGESARRIVFASGDDLEDDFVDDQTEGEREGHSSKVKREAHKYNGGQISVKHAIRKVNGSPKVVNFK